MVVSSHRSLLFLSPSLQRFDEDGEECDGSGENYLHWEGAVNLSLHYWEEASFHHVDSVLQYC